MKDLSYFPKIYIAVKPVDFRKQSRGLATVVKNVLNSNPLENKLLFAFTNKRRDSIRLLYWDQTGFALWSKVLEKDKYFWPKSKVDVKNSISSKELKWILQGIDLTKVKTHKKLNFDKIY